MGMYQIDNAQALPWTVSLFAAFFAGTIVLGLIGKTSKGMGSLLLGLVLGGMASLMGFHLAYNWMTKGGDLFSTDALTAAAGQSRDTINGWLNPDHTELRPVGGNGMPVAPPSTEPRVIYDRPPGPKVIPPNSVLARGRDSLVIPAPAPAAAPSDGRFVLACMRKVPFAVFAYMSPDELARLDAYRDGMAEVAGAMVRHPDPKLVKPLRDGSAIVLEAVAWDKSISKAGRDKFDIKAYPAGTAQACKAGHEEINRVVVR